MCTYQHLTSLQSSVLLFNKLPGTVLSLYLDERRGVQANSIMRLREFLRAQRDGTPKTECGYFPILPNSNKGTDIIGFVKVMKLKP